MHRPVDLQSPAVGRGKSAVKTINLGLQGGGAHGAFSWGVLDGLLEDGRIAIEGVSGTSAGAMNAAVYAQGNMTGGADGAREALAAFWRDMSLAGDAFSPVKQLPWEKLLGPYSMDASLTFNVFDNITRMFSPYEWNPFNFNPLRDIVDRSVDFEALHACASTKLFISATNVRTGKVKVFTNEDVTLDAIMASACLPFVYKAVEIDGEHYWDGGYMGNPAIFPFFYRCHSRDVMIVHVNPMVRDEVPMSAPDIMNRINEISFNSSLVRELRAIDFVGKLIDEEWLKDEYRDRLKKILVHSIRSDDALADLSVASKFDLGWGFLQDLRDRGREEARIWLDQNFVHLGETTTVDLKSEYLGASGV
ncbi:patatin-like phospholipase family protein [Pararhizobium haloflavum]|uniref:patatin-like phospholipase family protein n=1 Tax=Pararhizobium haloflavum TaxID=2037914 RepID=UPI000C18DCBF|nr:patatin-like phospholipase family protein [Pararhizobium haloflavum]